MDKVNPYLRAHLQGMPQRIAVLIEFQPGTVEAVKRHLGQMGVQVTGQSLNILHAQVQRDQVQKISSIPEVRMVHYDQPLRPGILMPKDNLSFIPLLPFSQGKYEFIPTSEVKRRIVDTPTKLRGRGVKIAVADSGAVDPLHPQNFFRVIPASKCLREVLPLDFLGHGSWVETTIFGHRFRAPLGWVEGIAPDATVISFKVLDMNGNGRTFDTISALEAALLMGADIVNLSLGGEIQGNVNDDPLIRACNILAQKGIILVTAVGNEPGVVSSPAASTSTIAVGSSSMLDDAPSWFSGGNGRKPDTYCYGGGRGKADLLPDELIYSGVTFFSKMDGMYTGIKTGFSGAHGTSMATAFVCGIIALWREAGLVGNTEEARGILKRGRIAKLSLA